MASKDCKTIFCRLSEELQSEFAVTIIAAVIVSLIFLVLLRPLWKWIKEKLEVIKRLLAKIRDKETRIDVLERRLSSGSDAVGMDGTGTQRHEGSGLWLSRTSGHLDPNAYRLRLQSSIPIWVFANLKGGVGKTTNATNIAAKYAIDLMGDPAAKPVLLLDLDYQGSASSMALSANVMAPTEGNDSLATKMVRGDLSAQDILTAPFAQKEGMLAGIPLRIVPAQYDLAQAENRLMIEWLFGEDPKDIRYTLADLLLDEQIQSNFSRIIIDAPPRLTTACIQALCAATHVIIPTVMDQLSGAAVSAFLRQIDLLKEKEICPEIKCAGIIGYRTGDPNADSLQAQRQIDDAIEKIKDALIANNFPADRFIEAPILVHTPLLAESAGQYIAIARTNPNYQAQLDAVKTTFNMLSEEIEKRL